MATISPTTNDAGIDRNDRAGLWLSIGIAAVLAGFTVWTAGTRLVEILANSQVSITGDFSATPVELSLAPSGTAVNGQLESATVVFSDLQPTILALLSLGVLLTALGTLGVITSVAWLCINLATGTAFSQTNTRLLMGASLSILVAWAGGEFFSHMGINGAFASLGEGAAADLTQGVSFFPFFAVLALSAASLAFKQGERIQRDLEGLV